MHKPYYYFAGLRKKLNGGVVSLRTKEQRKGVVLISYITYPFFFREYIDGHTNYWEARRFAEVFLERGYDVDVIDWTNNSFLPKKKYVAVFDIHNNLERLAPHLSDTTVKLFHATTSRFDINNNNEQKRLKEVGERRGVIFPTERMLAATNSPSFADLIVVLGGNDVLVDQYKIYGREVAVLPISTTHVFPEVARNHTTTRTSFVWIGGAGAIHKGADLLIEAFSALPDHTLYLCGKIQNDLFLTTFAKELSSPNIIRTGMLDLGSEEFDRIRSNASFVISPSCAEGPSGSVIVGMHAGLIPVVSRESCVLTQTIGVPLTTLTPEAIRGTVRTLSSRAPEELERLSHDAYNFARTHHTREVFNRHLEILLDRVEALISQKI